MILDVLDAVATVGELVDVSATLLDMFASHESPELLAKMKGMGRTESETTLAYKWALEQRRTH
jgi:hypothetical protein